MKAVRLLLLGLLLCPGAVVAQTAFVGVYQDSPGDYVAIVPLGSAQTLLLASTRTEQLRLLFPAGSDSFHTGAFIAEPEPREALLTFERDAGEVTGLLVSQGGTLRRHERIPIRQEKVEVRSDGIALSGTLLVGPRSGRRPGIVFAHGSEDSDRNSFGPLPWVLAAHGYAVMIYDKRGTGSSEGSWKDIGIEPLGSDLATMVRFLSSHPDVDASRIAVIGTSEGGWVAANALRHDLRIHAIIAISGGAQTKGEAYIHKARLLAIEQGLTGAALDSAVAAAALTIHESRAAVAAKSDPTGFDLRIAYDPTADWRRFRGAFLYLGGELDVLEPARESAAWFEEVMRSGGNTDYTIKLLPRGHHSLLHAVTGRPSEFASLNGIRGLVPGYWSVLLRWVDDRLSTPRRPSCVALAARSCTEGSQASVQ